jgi:hypothetical protein
VAKAVKWALPIGVQKPLLALCRARVVHRDLGRAREPSARFLVKAVVAGCQQEDHLAFGDVDAKPAQRCRQPRHRGLS